MKTTIFMTALMLGTVLTGYGIAEEPKKTADFSWDLFRTLVLQNPNENLACSPYGAELAIGAVGSGASGETESEIAAALNKQGDWKQYAAALRISEEENSPLTVATAVWMQQGQTLQKDFCEMSEQNFGALIEQVDFVGNSGDALKKINVWCSEKTQGKIPILYENFAANTHCVLANAVHFAADWKYPFDKEATLDGTFTLLNGTETTTKMMSQTSRMLYGETEKVVMLEIPYKNKGYSMLILFPKNADDFSKIETEISSGKLDTWRAELKISQINLRMPKFTIESKLTINESLKKLGIVTAFTHNADFSKINGKKDLYLSDVRQRIYVKVDEQGTEAAAATGAGFSVKSAIDAHSLYLNRPFLYLITKENKTLFAGRFVKPELSATSETDSGLSGEGGEFN
ncbi:MAG: serpin family protein [Planctomycetaceae bacterium]|nr:serpin family protein [Planctomycetaceae bacterium]